MSYPGSTNASWLLLGSTALAATGAAALVLLQTDAFSRRVLSPRTLQTQRQAMYQRQWQRALDRAVQRIRVGHVQSVDRLASTQEQANHAELLGTEFVRTEAELEELLSRFLREENQGNYSYRIARIGRDTKNNEHGSRDYFVWLVQQEVSRTDRSSTSADTTSAISYYQVPLSLFAHVLSDMMDRRITVDTFLFVADGACGVGTNLVSRLLQAISSGKSRDSSSKMASIVNLQTPLWLIQLSVLMERRALSQTTLDNLLFGMCRLQAHLHCQSLDRQPEPPSARNRTARTIAFMLPSATVPILLAPLQRVFPNDRHVFCYTGCHQSVQAALRLEQCTVSKASTAFQTKNIDSLLLWSMSDLPAIPLSTRLQQSASLLLVKYFKAMKGLTRHHARLVETWMSCADAYLSLKEQESGNGPSDLYLPYVCKLEFLYYGKIEKGSDAFWALRSLLQYITGTKSTELPEDMMQAAAKELQHYTEAFGKLPPITDLSPDEQGAIQEAVFAHKLILIANKVLVDTCLPAEHWQLKQALRQGCSCCVLEAEVEEEMSKGADRLTSFDSSAASGSTNSSKPRSGYVDGKMMFAFDPTRFQ